MTITTALVIIVVAVVLFRALSTLVWSIDHAERDAFEASYVEAHEAEVYGTCAHATVICDDCAWALVVANNEANNQEIKLLYWR